jgi:hypothetical protein
MILSIVNALFTLKGLNQSPTFIYKWTAEWPRFLAALMGMRTLN